MECCEWPGCNDRCEENLLVLFTLGGATGRLRLCAGHLAWFADRLDDDDAAPTESLAAVADYQAPMAAARRVGPPPWLGADVMYRSEGNDRLLAAKVARTMHSGGSEHPSAVQQGRLYLVPLGPRDVDLVVFDVNQRSDHSTGGTYVEHNVRYDPTGAAGTWHWPDEGIGLAASG